MRLLRDIAGSSDARIGRSITGVTFLHADCADKPSADNWHDLASPGVVLEESDLAARSNR
jgi:hypothetical protein